MKARVGLLATLPFLLSLMTMAAFLFAGRLAVAIQEGTTPSADAPNAVEVPPPKLEIPPELPRALPPRPRQPVRLATPDSGAQRDTEEQELRELEMALAAKRRAQAELEHERARLADRLAEIEKLEAKVATARLSREEIERRLARLREEIAKLAAEITTVQRELPAKGSVPARDLVPGGSLRPAVFVETNAEGAWLMPERARLEPSVPPVDRERFLARARAKGYVVFLVRPDGFTSFERYRDVIETHNRTSDVALDYGYEPVNTDWRLHYPTN